MDSTKNTNVENNELTEIGPLKKRYFENELKKADRQSKITKTPFTMKEKKALVENLFKKGGHEAKEEIMKNREVRNLRKKMNKLTKQQQLERLMKIKKTIADDKNIPNMFKGSIDVFRKKVDKSESDLRKIIAIDKVKAMKKLKEAETTQNQ